MEVAVGEEEEEEREEEVGDGEEGEEAVRNAGMDLKWEVTMWMRVWVDVVVAEVLRVWRSGGSATLCMADSVGVMWDIGEEREEEGEVAAGAANAGDEREEVSVACLSLIFRRGVNAVEMSRLTRAGRVSLRWRPNCERRRRRAMAGLIDSVGEMGEEEEEEEEDRTEADSGVEGAAALERVSDRGLPDAVSTAVRGGGEGEMAMAMAGDALVPMGMAAMLRRSALPPAVDSAC